jgi:hypothetical protein
MPGPRQLRLFARDGFPRACPLHRAEPVNGANCQGCRRGDFVVSKPFPFRSCLCRRQRRLAH